jgi:hypothetical protein
MTRARDTADGIARAITDGIIVDADINASAAIAQSKVANLSTTFSGISNSLTSKVDYSLPVNTQAGTTYTFVLADDARLTAATSASAKTFTVPPQSSVVWTANDIIRVVNYGAGALTINGGVGVTVTNTASTIAQFQSAAVIRTAENAWTLVPFSGGASNADFSNTATGTYTDGGVNYKYVQFTSSSTLTITKAGVADILVVGAGGTGFTNGIDTSGGGGAGAVTLVSTSLAVGSYSAIVAASYGGTSTFNGNNGIFCRGGFPAGGGGGASGNGFSGGGPPISGGGGSTSNASGNTGGAGYTSTITGSSVVYALGGNNAGARSGFGTGRDSGNTGGGLGVVIIRVRV